MPMGGLEVVRALEARCTASTMFVAVLTGEDRRDPRRSCLDAGADDVLVKPISPAELRRRLARCVAHPSPRMTLAPVASACEPARLLHGATKRRRRSR